MPVPKLIRSERRRQVDETSAQEVAPDPYERKLRQRASDLTAHESFDEASVILRQIQHITRFTQPI